MESRYIAKKFFIKSYKIDTTVARICVYVSMFAGLVLIQNPFIWLALVTLHVLIYVGYIKHRFNKLKQDIKKLG